MNGHLRVRRMWVALFAALVMAGCNSGPVGIAHRPAPTLPFDSQRIVLELNQAWASTGPNSGAYRNVFNLEGQPSLYETSWHLKVASEIGISIPNVSAAETADWIDAVLSDPASAHGYSPLEAIYLSIGALHGLGRPIPATALAGIDSLQVGDLYAWDAKAQPSWSATTLAVKALTEAGGKPSGALAASVRRALPSATAASDPTGWLEQLIPVWTLADLMLPTSDRADMRNELSATVSRLRSAIGTQPLGEQTVFLMAQVTEIARANNLAGLDIPESALNGLATSFGYLASSQADPTPSMVNTFYAIETGYAAAGSQARQALAAYLQWSAAPKGWREDFTSPGPAASFYAWEVSKALGETGPADALRAQVVAWLAVAAKSATLAGVGSLDDLYFLILLGKSLDVAVPQKVADLIRAELQATSDGLAAPYLVSLARLSSVLGMPAGDHMKRRWLARERELDLSITRQAQAAFTIAFALGDAHVTAVIESHLSGLHDGPLWVVRAGAPAPDLQSTATGAVVLGRSPALAKAARGTFADHRGFWLLPPAITRGNVVDLRTLYIGLWLTSDLVDSGGVI
jgi:hypothetical protein